MTIYFMHYTDNEILSKYFNNSEGQRYTFYDGLLNSIHFHFKETKLYVLNNTSSIFSIG